jgi:chloramphenicol 3-O phosphotransferase
MKAMAFAATETGVPPGTVVVLNGTSSAGKTGIARELQTLLDEPSFSLGIDYFFGMLQLRHWAEADARVVSGMHHCTATLASLGNNVILDSVAFGERLAECVTVLHTLPVLFVGVRCPLHIAQQRELARGDRTPGQAANQIHLVHAHGVYDLEVDTSVLSSLECAHLIKRRLETGPQPTAFRQLYARIQGGDVRLGAMQQDPAHSQSAITA